MRSVFVVAVAVVACTALSGADVRVVAEGGKERGAVLKASCVCRNVI